MKKYFDYIFILLITFMFSSIALASDANKSSNSNIAHPMVIHQIVEQVRENNNWKLALATGKHAQVVLMTISPATNPNNEIGMETHAFDQVIIIVEGEGEAILNGAKSTVRPGDLIFISQGTAHNIINLNRQKPLKLISFYSSNDIPANSVFLRKSDEPKE